MDLLVENTRRPSATLHPSPSAHLNPVTSLNQRLPQTPAPYNQRPVPIRTPIQATVSKAAYTPLEPNYKLDLCCKKQQVSSVCQGMCNFDTFTDRSVSWSFDRFKKV
jgi:hypothetical protein